MAWKTVSICRKTKEIAQVLQDILGYTVTNIKNILIDNFGYKNTKDILNRLPISQYALYTPLVYRDRFGYSTIIHIVEIMLDDYNSGEIRKIYCDNFYDSFKFGKQNIALYQFRAEHVYEEQIKLLLKQHKFINYESRYYLP